MVSGLNITCISTSDARTSPLKGLIWGLIRKDHVVLLEGLSQMSIFALVRRAARAPA